MGKTTDSIVDWLLLATALFIAIGSVMKVIVMLVVVMVLFYAALVILFSMLVLL